MVTVAATLAQSVALRVAVRSLFTAITSGDGRSGALDTEFQGALAAAYVLCHRVALVVARAALIYLAEGAAWEVAYVLLTVLMAGGAYPGTF